MTAIVHAQKFADPGWVMPFFERLRHETFSSLAPVRGHAGRSPATMACMGLMLRRGEKIPMKGRTITVTDSAYACLPPVRDRLIDVAKSGETITYGELREELDLPYLAQGMGRLLDLLSEDCFRRNEPSLASIVVSKSTGEVGRDFGGDPVAERGLVYKQRRWS